MSVLGQRKHAVKIYKVSRNECRAIATPHFDLQVKEACLGYAE
jgi:hypothetical protein